MTVEFLTSCRCCIKETRRCFQLLIFNVPNVRFFALHVVRNLDPVEMSGMEDVHHKAKIYEDSVRTLSYLFSLDIEPFLMVF